MANQLAMDKALAIKNLAAAGHSGRRIAEILQISRKAVRRHLAADFSKDAKAPTGSAKHHYVEPWSYLRDALTDLARSPEDLTPLLPDAWLQSHPESRLEYRKRENEQAQAARRQRRARRKKPASAK